MNSKARVTLIGDSLIEDWLGTGRAVRAAYLPGCTVLGYNGFRPEQIADRLRRGDLAQVGGTVVVMAGINSFTAEKTPETIAADVRELVEVVRPPARRVVLCSILPAFLWGKKQWPRIQQTN